MELMNLGQVIFILETNSNTLPEKKKRKLHDIVKILDNAINNPLTPGDFEKENAFFEHAGHF